MNQSFFLCAFRLFLQASASTADIASGSGSVATPAAMNATNFGAQAVMIQHGDHAVYAPGRTIRISGTLLLSGSLGNTPGNDRLGFFVGNGAGTGNGEWVDGRPDHPAYGLALNTSVWRRGANQTTQFARNGMNILENSLLAAGTPAEIGKTVSYALRLRFPDTFGTGLDGATNNEYAYELLIQHTGTDLMNPSYIASGKFRLYEHDRLRIGFIVQKSPTDAPSALTNQYTYRIVEDPEGLPPFPDQPNPQVIERNPNAPFRMHLPALFGMNYTLSYATNLNEHPVEWTPLATYPGNEGPLELEDSIQSEPMRVYRVYRKPIPAPPPPPSLTASDIQHVAVYSADGRFAGWPAACGAWSWDNEMLVGYIEGAHLEGAGHTIDDATARFKFARSLDGGVTWTIEDALEKGIDGYAHRHEIGAAAQPPIDLDHSIAFDQPGFAMTFRTEHNPRGPAHFYYTYDRGALWNGPYNLPDFGTPGIAARTDYIVDGPNELLAFLTAAKSDGGQGRVLCARTTDGGQHWTRMAWIGPEPLGYAIMPSSVRLSESHILTVIRYGDDQNKWLSAHHSRDNGLTWEEQEPPLRTELNSPPALIRLPDGRIVFVYVDRGNRDGGGATVCAKISADDGATWSDEILLRGGEDASWDVGYPVVRRRLDGKLVIAYYWNNALNASLPPYRRIEVSIWDPNDIVPLP